MTRWGETHASQANKKEHKRKLILQQAAISFNRRGSHGVTLDEVAAKLRVSKAALYRYIDSKNDLLLACHLEAVQIAQNAADAADRMGGDGWTKIRMTLQRHLQDMIKILGVPSMLLEEDSLEPADMCRIVELRDAYEGRLRAFYEAGIADGSVLPGNSRIAIFTLLGALNWTAKWYRADGMWQPEEIAEAIVETVSRGISTKPREQFFATLHASMEL